VFAALIVAVGHPAQPNAQTAVEYEVPTAGANPQQIAAGADGALWFTEFGGNAIGRITTSGTITEFPLPTGDSEPNGIAAGPDGALWFTELAGNRIGRIATSGTIAEFPIPTAASSPFGIALGPDGALWFTEFVGKIGRITASGSITEYPTPTTNSAPGGIAAGSDGALWFTEAGANKIGRVTTTGSITEFPLPTPSSLFVSAGDITAGPDGALWFTETGRGRIGRITTAGIIREFPMFAPTIPNNITTGPDGGLWFTTLGAPFGGVGTFTTAGVFAGLFSTPTSQVPAGGIAAGPDGALWFTETTANRIGRSSPFFFSGSPLVAAVLPSSRSVEVGNTATAYATIINNSTSAATGCAIAPVTSVPASFVYQTSDPTTNALTGTPNMPVNIPAGGSQTFVIGLTADAPMVPTEVVFGFACSGMPAAAINPGLNTMLYSASAAPVPDLLAVAATMRNDGIVHITGGMGSFAVATTNLGAGAAITATANPGALPLPVSLCETNPATGACLTSISSSVSSTISANATPTFGIFVAASGTVANLPATNRITVQFSDPGGAIRGSTSVAVETQ
jgi:virginiamycin B lyase